MSSKVVCKFIIKNLLYSRPNLVLQNELPKVNDRQLRPVLLLEENDRLALYLLE